MQKFGSSIHLPDLCIINVKKMIMTKQIVGYMEEYPVYFIPGREVIFCKNTALPLCVVKEAVNGRMDRTTIEEKDLTITRDGEFFTFGCLTTTKTNARNILGIIKKL